MVTIDGYGDRAVGRDAVELVWLRGVFNTEPEKYFIVRWVRSILAAGVGRYSEDWN